MSTAGADFKLDLRTLTHSTLRVLIVSASPFFGRSVFGMVGDLVPGSWGPAPDPGRFLVGGPALALAA
jgi:hypothetical protein